MVESRGRSVSRFHLPPPSRGRTLKSGSQLLHLLRETEGSAPLHSRLCIPLVLSNSSWLISCRFQWEAGIPYASPIRIQGSDHGNANCKSSGADPSPSHPITQK